MASPAITPAEASAAGSQQRTTKKTSAKSSATTKRYSSSRARARRARLARARAAAYARELQELRTPRFKTDAAGQLVPDVRAEAAIVYDPVTHEVLFSENAQDERSIASITKVMTAVVYLEQAADVDEVVEIQPADLRAASTTYLRSRERVTGQNLLHLLLMGSDNAAARALARSSALGAEGFIERMNTKALELGLQHTHYADPSGLLDTNVSSAFDMARLISFASGDERIASIMRKGEETVATSRRTFRIKNTNKLVGGDVLVRGGKTGFIRKAGYCLATLLQLPQGGQVAVVVLGARSNAGRFMETRHLVNWLTERTQGLLGTDVVRPLEQPQPQQQ